MLLLAGTNAYCQIDSVASAFKYMQKSELDKAKVAIDAAVNNEETSVQAQTWHIRGFIYKELYKKLEINNKNSALRLESFSSFRQSIKLDVENEFDNKPSIKFLAAGYFNDAASTLLIDTLDERDYLIALANYEKYKEGMLIVDPATNFIENDSYIKLNLANIYYKTYERDPIKNEQFFEKAKDLYLKVLEADSNNERANYHLGILYYNKAVNIIKDLDYDMDMFALMEIQEQTLEIFKQSLPFMEKAYSLNPQKEQTLKGLMGIYYSLNDEKKSNEMKDKLDKLEK